MKKLIIAAFLFSAATASAQSSTLQQALATAKNEHKKVLLTFSGSDWCIPCIRMEKEVFTKEDFTHYANEHLVLVHADFPRLKKHQLPDAVKKENEGLAEKYNAKGTFPFTVLLDEEGTVIKAWEGIVATSPSQFIQQIEATQHGR